ncbi:hypothetical protein AKJ50_00915 [candidate division MSBL1 archaeon SCGC-AAA382A13]|uniref:Saccharopine dehydrogenase n=1 Tax=candidate division MSBL1 archaeon SCGC-AAA382A13 TaxID=1698279 RepID=A0A133VG86_9EURY|nr:hypothetical protein AKJ50_00915 [candidate division MSBL1 archaeon SCGC-AAA382A13]
MTKLLMLGGAGAMGSETTKDLVKTSDFSEIVLGDNDVEKAEKFASKLDDDRLSVIEVDASDVDDLAEKMEGFDIVASALPYRFDLNVTKACVRTGVDGIDLDNEEDQWDYNKEAKEKGITYIPGCGATPGTTNLMARRGVELLEEAEEVSISFAAFRSTAIAPGLLQTTFAEFEPDIESRIYYENGKFIQVPPLTGGKSVEFHEQIGKQEVVYIPHPETKTIPATFSNLNKVEVRGCFPPKTMELVKLLNEYDFYREEPISVDDQQIKPLDFIRELLLNTPSAKKAPVWAYGLIVEVSGTYKEKPAKVTLKNNHPSMDKWGGKSAYGKNVGIPLSIGVQMLAEGKIDKKGVKPPEEAIKPTEFFEELSKRGIEIQEDFERYAS